MKLAFLMRSDFKQKRGGDVVQVEAYCRELERMGHQCKLLDVLENSDCQGYDGFILVNIDRPVETVDYWRMIKASAPDAKVFLIPIHHPISAINKFERKRRGLGYSIFNSFFPDFYFREKIKNLVRFRRNRRLLLTSLGHLGISYRRAISDILRSVDGIIYISEGEKNSVEHDFDVVSSRYVVAHNAVELAERPDFIDWSSRKYDVVVVGRIEPRKNQLSVLQALGKSGHKVCFIGSVNKNSDSYCDEFLKRVNESANFDYLGVMPHGETLKVVANSRMLLNTSYFEVNPLVDLEAALVRTQVITTKYSYTPESLPNADLVDPWDVKDIRRKVEDLLGSRKNTLKGARVSESWYEPAKKIEEMILGAHAESVSKKV